MTRIVSLDDKDTWDFAGCPTDQVPACLYYECAREIAAEIEQVRTVLTGSGHYQPWGIKYAAYYIPGFPETPWLKLDPMARQEFVAPFLHPVEYGNPDDVLMMVPEAFRDISERLQQQYDEYCVPDPPDLPVGFIHQDYRPCSWVVLDLDWTKSDRHLREEFARILKRRPPQYRRKHTGKNIQRDLLNGLSGMRLLAYHRERKFPDPPETTLEAWQKRAKKCPYSDARALRASIRRIKLFMEGEFPLNVVRKRGEDRRIENSSIRG